MFTKHFFKTLFVFTAMIILGLIGVYLVSSFGNKEGESNILDSIKSPRDFAK